MSNWRDWHANAMLYPGADEAPMVGLIDTIGEYAQAYGSDYVLREGVAKLILGAEIMLDSVNSDRLDRGTLDDELERCAELIGFDRDLEIFKDERDAGSMQRLGVVERHSVACGPGHCVCAQA